jgi:hypothetical protein
VWYYGVGDDHDGDEMMMTTSWRLHVESNRRCPLIKFFSTALAAAGTMTTGTISMLPLAQRKRSFCD